MDHIHDQEQSQEPEIYYFDNPFEDYSPELAMPLIDGNRCPRAGSNVVAGVRKRWELTMNKIGVQTIKDDYTVYTGTAGVALLKLKRDSSSQESLEQIKNLLLEPPPTVSKHNLAVKHLFSEHKLETKIPPSFLCGDSGPLSIGAVVYQKLKNKELYQRCLKQLTAIGNDLFGHSCEDMPNGVLYGRAGYLYAILYVNKRCTPPPFEDFFVRKIIENILICGQKEAKEGKFKCPLMYRYRDNYNLGAARGSAGIIYLLLQVRDYLSKIELQKLIKPTIDFLTTLRAPSGNFPREYGMSEDRKVQWCHGAPGFVFMYCEAYKTYNDPNYLRLALECGDFVWQRGILKKGYSMCHGVAGNAYCFLILYQTTQELKHLYRAIRFTEWCLDYSKAHEGYTPDHPLSLFEGICGPMYLLLDIQHPFDAKYPGFTL